jgi:hypothetical protein
MTTETNGRIAGLYTALSEVIALSCTVGDRIDKALASEDYAAVERLNREREGVRLAAQAIGARLRQLQGGKE